MSERGRLSSAKRWVIKIGSALLTDEGRGLDVERIDNWVTQMCRLRRAGIEIVLVSSGAVAAGMEKLGLDERPSALNELQAAAAVGQARLVQVWEESFQKHGFQPAQILLTHADHSNRQRYLNARSTLNTLLDMGVVPVVNENDTVATEEVRFGDNDTLGALVTNLVEADMLVLMTDQDGLFTADPRKDPTAQLMDNVRAQDKRLDAMAGGGSGRLGRGGMQTKLRAARQAAASGAATVIVGGRMESVLERLYAEEALGTLLLPDHERMAARKQWLQGHMQTSGELVLDAGAVDVLVTKGKSLLPVGVREVRGAFQRGEMVSCLDESGQEVARGLINYGDKDARKIIGKPSELIGNLLGYSGEPELLHRNNMVLAG
ncbi:gamma-glutamyl kinase [Endozoicomonas montiporae]|uniref:Glutamate 5-kinase n=2 Tax=Endozoicomonas montiporae TaxID=1027273 RepID=A0A081N7P0_9GAMM|nr:glutamate 5-kinase [Endozoicomonas montiporae]AMO55685.1 gamma-glutamyl kinase [Endozoicomonas montiporae CL-33]KEQ14463.1 gamma-glutamyl kinase [Endozoicomonas montiporae]